MKRDKLFSLTWASALSLLLGLGSVGALATGLDLPVALKPLVLWCIALAFIIAIGSGFDHGAAAVLSLSAIASINPDLQEQLKAIGAAIALRLQLAYGIPTPEFFQGEQTETVLAALCFISTLIMLLTAYSVQRQKSLLPAALLSLLPLAGCITVTDTVPEDPWLFLWGLGLTLLLLTQGVRRRDHRQANRLTALLALPTAAALMLLFILVPKDAPEKWALLIPEPQLSEPSGSTTGAPAKEQVDLTDLGPRILGDTPVMEVTADFTGPLYLRSRDYDEYTGTGWLSTPNRSEILYGYSLKWHNQRGRVEIKNIAPQDYYVIPAYTMEVQTLTGGMVENPDRQTEYGFDYCTLQPDWALGWNSEYAPVVNPRYLELPEATAQQAARYLGDGGTLQQIEKIRSLVRYNAPYDLFTPNMPTEETDLALWFLEDAPSGYCVHYATAAAVLLRAAGIPARYVEGYLVQVTQGEPTTVRGLHAHAWVEYYLDGLGWLVLEATPSEGTTPEVTPTTAPTEGTTEPSTEPTQEATESQPATEPTQPKPNTVTPTPKSQGGWVLIGVAALCLAAAMVLAQYLLRRQIIRRRLRQKDLNRRGLAIYRQINRLCKFLREPVPEEVTLLAQKARFSPHSLTGSELKALTQQLHTAQQKAAQSPWYRRLWAKWILALY